MADLAHTPEFKDYGGSLDNFRDALDMFITRVTTKKSYQYTLEPLPNDG